MKEIMKVVFMGTPDFAVPVLERLIASEEYEVVLVVTQPDKAKGRSGTPVCSPVKTLAVQNKIPVFQPARIKKEVQTLKKYCFDAVVVAAFGQILPKAILELPRYGCINVHGSLLPRWRGAAPIQWAILAGDAVTGITTMLMDEGLDTGQMLLKREIEIEPKETGGQLFDRMSLLGAELLTDTLNGLKEGLIVPEKQDDEQSTYAKMLTKAQGKLDFTKPAAELERMVRAFNPWPSAYTTYGGKTLKIWDASAEEKEDEKEETEAKESNGGEIVRVTKDALFIQTQKGCLVVRELQWEGKKRMKTADFLCGIHVEKGQKCGQ